MKQNRSQQPATIQDLDKLRKEIRNDIKLDLIDVVAKLDARWDKRFSNLENRFDHFRDETLTRLDEGVVILKRLDQERIFTTEWIRRIEADVALLKKYVGLA